jgi:hypothetical protein
LERFSRTLRPMEQAACRDGGRDYVDENGVTRLGLKDE